MQQLQKTLLVSLLLSTIPVTAVHAAAFQFYELGTPIIGTAGVGQAAVAEDASTSYFNPAGMTLLPGTQFMVGGQMLIPYMNFSKYSYNTVTGDNGGNAGSLTPGLGLYFAYSYTPDLKIGVSVTTPYGGEMNFDNGWAGRYYIQNVFFYTINLNPSVAYRVSKWLSLAGGVAIEYINMQNTIALPVSTSPLVDGQAKVSVADTAPGFNLGVMLTPYDATKIGLAYRSQIVHNMSGNTTFYRITTTPATTSKIVMPSNLIVSLSQGLSPTFTLLGELGWSNWSSMQNVLLNVAGYSLAVPQHWQNTYRFGLGGQYSGWQKWILQAGASYDSSPTTNAKRLANLPMDRQIRLGAGVMYRLIKPVTLGVSYEYINFGKAAINNTSTLGVLAGYYSRNYADAIQVSLNVDV